VTTLAGAVVALGGPDWRCCQNRGGVWVDDQVVTADVVDSNATAAERAGDMADRLRLCRALTDDPGRRDDELTLVPVVVRGAT
jgi:hypothetical protein